MTVASLAMPESDRSSFAKALRAAQASVTNAGPAAAASYGLLGAVLLLGGIGWALDARFETSPVFLATGLLLGVAVGLYQLAKVLWRR